MANICISVVTFDRPKSFARLFASLLRGDYAGDTVDLIVSVDGGARSEDMLGAIGTLDWPHGACTIRRMSENLGLRRHILHCGDAVADYDALILLEDDIVVGPDFYKYARWACDHYGGDADVAGISLYAPAFNEMAGLPFTPAPSANAVYALQSAQSWGQCWTKAMWTQFRDWYQAHPQTLAPALDMPDRIYSWPDSSWKKFAMKYLVEIGKTWIYPYVSHSTNCSEVGMHNRQLTSLFQVPLAAGDEDLVGQPLESLIHYDIYFERVDAPVSAEIAAVGEGPVTFDLYGTRQAIKGPAQLLTTRSLPRAAAAQIGLQFKPHEVNAEFATSGDAASLYHIAPGETLDLRAYKRRTAVGYYASTDWRDSLKAGAQGLVGAVARRIKP